MSLRKINNQNILVIEFDGLPSQTADETAWEPACCKALCWKG